MILYWTVQWKVRSGLCLMSMKSICVHIGMEWFDETDGCNVLLVFTFPLAINSDDIVSLNGALVDRLCTVFSYGIQDRVKYTCLWLIWGYIYITFQCSPRFSLCQHALYSWHSHYKGFQEVFNIGKLSQATHNGHLSSMFSRKPNKIFTCAHHFCSVWVELCCTYLWLCWKTKDIM